MTHTGKTWLGCRFGRCERARAGNLVSVFVSLVSLAPSRSTTVDQPNLKVPEAASTQPGLSARCSPLDCSRDQASRLFCHPWSHLLLVHREARWQGEEGGGFVTGRRLLGFQVAALGRGAWQWLYS